jgi:hypothetical protein
MEPQRTTLTASGIFGHATEIRGNVIADLPGTKRQSPFPIAMRLSHLNGRVMWTARRPSLNLAASFRSAPVVPWATI